MMYLETKYFSVNRILLLAVGLWPYQQTKLVRLQYILFSSVLTTATIFQFTTFMTSRCNLNLVLQILSTAFFFICLLIVYIWFHFNIELMKDLLGQLLHICNNIKDDNEIAIIEKYSYNAKLYTVVLSIFVVSGIIAAVIFGHSYIILDVIMPLNVSRPHHRMIITEYFIDEDKYHYFILFHLDTASCIAAITTLATGTMVLTYIKHICAMFTVASYRIERAMGINMLLNLKNKNLTFKGIIHAVDIHRQAMKLSTLLISSFEMPGLCILMIIVFSLSLNLFRVSQIGSSENDMEEFLLPALFVFFDIGVLFIGNYIGQDVIDHNRHLFVTVYDVQWYIAPLDIQKLILFLLQKGIKDFTLNMGVLFVASMQCFATLINTAVSYFTVIYSTR